jgi:hypothetical protein
VKKEKLFPYLYLSVGIVSFAYVFLRAIYVGITFDESWTITTFVPQSVYDIINFTECDANNHLVNTLLIKLFYLFDYQTLFVARLPNVLAFLLFLIYGYKIGSRLIGSWVGLSCFSLLILNPFLLDFFSLARGYGLAMGFLISSIYFAIKFLKDSELKTVVASLFFGMLAVLSNFSVLNYWMSMVLLINLLPFVKKNSLDFKVIFATSLGFSILLLTLLFNPISKLIENDSLFYGGNTSFYFDTLGSLTDYFLYNSASSGQVFFFLDCFLAILLGALVYSALHTKRELVTPKNFLFALTLLSFLAVVFQHLLLNTVYLIDRTALFFYVLLILLLCFSIQEFATYVYAKILLAVVVIFGINFFQHANFYKTTTWYFDAHSEDILKTINEIGKSEKQIQKIDFSWPFVSSIKYYWSKKDYPYIEIIKNERQRDDINPDADYYVFLNRAMNFYRYFPKDQRIHPFEKDTIQQYPSEDIYVFKLL